MNKSFEMTIKVSEQNSDLLINLKNVKNKSYTNIDNYSSPSKFMMYQK